MSDQTHSSDEPEADRRTFLRAVGGTAAATAGLSGTASATDRPGAGRTDTVPITHGVASGDVTARTAVVWARAADEATLHVEFGPDESFSTSRRKRTTVDSSTDFTGQIRLTGLQPATRYHYRVWATSAGGSDGANAASAPESAVTGTFVTAPARNEAGGVSFAWSGDTWGYGDDPVEPPYPGLRTIAERQPDFFLYLGDTIYADANTPAGKITENTPIEDALDIYRGKYREMRDPPAEVAERTNLRMLLEATSVYSVWDDHEVINNFAGPIEPLMPEGRRAFLEYWPLDRAGSGGSGDPNRLYGSFRWGEHLELFVIDTRQYRDPNVELDSKTLLGREQLDWLKDALSQSDATWKVLASPAPLGYPSDSWATPADRTGYEAELLEVVRHVQTEPVSNFVVVAGDVHKSVVGAFDPDDDGEFEFYEAIAGPLGAPAGKPDDLYPPLNPTEFFSKGEYTNFGTVTVDESGETLTLGIYDEEGTEQFTKTIAATEADAATSPPDRVESTFDEDAEGWLVSNNGGSNLPEYFESGGNPGGHIGDAENKGGVAWYYQAPFKFLGDRAAFYGGTLSFDLRQEQTDRQFDAEPTEGGDVLLVSGERKLVYEFRGPDATPGTEWTSFEVPLTADAPWIDLASEEPLATEDTLRAVLEDLEVIRIRGEYRGGDDRSYLDNVVLERG
ncbi:alkaline phosphatase D family protein [Halomarina halobia]|uniref:Alkaline phosphatase D family protein n=1 Tax=Halomarina halobia TaxID=3033386 RepID=A0ABD6AEB8_9EURY|nr:alkaline phosphatase D family protein [Halomarina sp. PSR21]